MGPRRTTPHRQKGQLKVKSPMKAPREPYVTGPPSKCIVKGHTYYRTHVAGDQYHPKRRHLDADGKVIRIDAAGYQSFRKPIYGKTPTECRKKANAEALRLGAKDLGKAADPEGMTLQALLDEYQKIARLEPGGLEPKTLIKDKTCRNGILKVLGNTTPIALITDTDIRGDKENGIAGVKGDREQDQRNLVYLRKALAFAIERKWRDGPNPADFVSDRSQLAIEKSRVSRSDIPDALIKQLFAHIADDPYRLAFYYLQCFRGLRISEALALRWSKFDRDEGTMIVDAQVNDVDVRATGATKRQKTGAGRRVITLGHTAITLLDELREAQRREAAARKWTSEKRDPDLIFPSSDGIHWSPGNWRDRLEEPLFIELGWPTYVSTRGKKPKTKALYSAHWFRHTCATWLRELHRDGEPFPSDFHADELGHERDYSSGGGAKAAKSYDHSAQFLERTVQPRKRWIALMEARVDPLLPQAVRDRIAATLTPLRRAS